MQITAFDAIPASLTRRDDREFESHIFHLIQRLTGYRPKESFMLIYSYYYDFIKKFDARSLEPSHCDIPLPENGGFLHLYLSSFVRIPNQSYDINFLAAPKHLADHLQPRWLELTGYDKLITVSVEPGMTQRSLTFSYQTIQNYTELYLSDFSLPIQ